MRIAMTAVALGAACLMSGTSMAFAGRDRITKMCRLDLMRHHERAAVPA